MKRIQVVAYLIIAFFLVTASQSQFSIAIRIQAMGTVDEDTKIRTAKPKPNSGNRFLLSTWEPETQFNDNMRKVPSSPNPIGNRHPPSKP
ncbi:uncharacterized protein LOC110424898 isoform X2 [Herrania umbratica]|uniref:Uncharacterized protein LOC110424898 isoform X2 n=1 Tax=Herrania umbratica TaxID=108875 RepID=A0A6J1B7F5_9ROSI|nr:uncharacterized protein LOC110424898 isoform X2 [Herrania umbratica]